PPPGDGSDLPENVRVQANLTGKGKTLRSFLGSANGPITVRTGKALFNNKLVGLIGQSLFTALIPNWSSSQGANIICSVLELQAKDGKARSTVLVIDGQRLLIGGGGAIDLGTGKLDAVLIPKAKNATLAPLVAPIHLQGTIIDPKVVGSAESILSGAGHLLLGIVNPTSLATPILQPGLKGDQACRDPSLVQQSDSVESIGTGAADAVKGAAEDVGSAIEGLGERATDLLDRATGQ
ncbi:MAG: hypothetical protein AAF637_17615, partial [Pseudomonadota bacterium]